MTAKIVFVFFSWALLVLSWGQVNGQTSSGAPAGDLALPQVFKLGDNSQQYEKLMHGYESLLDACDGDMRVAHSKLYGMMKEMEALAASMGYDLNGVKAWMHFFWKEDGSIEHIGFYLKPNSRNVNVAELGSFLKKFSQQYHFPLASGTKYTHYSTFSFPAF